MSKEINHIQDTVSETILPEEIDIFISEVLNNHTEFSFFDKITMTKELLIKCKNTIEDLENKLDDYHYNS